MATQNKFQDFVEQLELGKHIFGTHVFKWMLTNTAPVATNTIKANITEIAAGNGYTAGGPAVATTVSEAAGVSTVQAAQAVITAAGGAIGPFRYAVLYNDTQGTPVKPLVCWVDYGAPITLNDTEALTIQCNGANPGTLHTVT